MERNGLVNLARRANGFTVLPLNAIALCLGMAVLALALLRAPGLFAALTGDSSIPLLGFALGLVATAILAARPSVQVSRFVPSAVLAVMATRFKELDPNARKLLAQLADVVDRRDPYTGEHSRRVADLVAEIVGEMGTRGQEARLIVMAARMHDIGKMHVPQDLVMKPASLTDQERIRLEEHAELGARFLHLFPRLRRGAEIVRHHHESWDGTGYPLRLRGTDIPFGSRVIAVADSFDAMVNDRPYRAGMDRDQAIAILAAGRGRQWDPMVVDALLRIVRREVEVPRPEPMRAAIPVGAPSAG